MTTRRQWIRQTVVGLVMLPLSLLPFAAYFQKTQEGEILWARVETTVAPPKVQLDPEEVEWAKENAPSYEGSVALLVYHGLGTGAAAGEGRFTVTPERFASQLATLRAAGMQDVTAREVALAHAGLKPLPPNAVMVSFDDGRQDAMLYADPILEQLDMRATMFVITSTAADAGIYYVGWDRLQELADTGRWDMQSHTDDLHRVQDVEGSDEPLPMLTSAGPDEDADDYARRVRDDLLLSHDLIEERIGTPPVAFAYPFGAHGGDERRNVPGAEDVVRSSVASAYTVAFDQDEQEAWTLASCADDPHRLSRLEVGDWTGRELLTRISSAAETTPRSHCTDVRTTGAGEQRREAMTELARESLVAAAELEPAPDIPEGIGRERGSSVGALVSAVGDAIGGCDVTDGICVGQPEPAETGLVDAIVGAVRGASGGFATIGGAVGRGPASAAGSSPPSGGSGDHSDPGSDRWNPPSVEQSPPSSGGQSPPSSGGGSTSPTPAPAPPSGGDQPSGGSSPGHGGSPPGRSGESPGNSGNAPGQNR